MARDHLTHSLDDLDPLRIALGLDLAPDRGHAIGQRLVVQAQDLANVVHGHVVGGDFLGLDGIAPAPRRQPREWVRALIAMGFRSAGMSE